ncbi:MAG: hypothetical protein OEW02_13330, partial [Myxococcales bacterium]|nr:hypothetical protein [Myxococcales bacterium]
MLDPRWLTERRDEIEESCRRRGVRTDLDAAAQAQLDVAAARTALGELNRQRNAHQGAGKRKLGAEEREAHIAEGRRIKQEAAQIETQLAAAEA